jgi:peptide/nickel transport system permease protein
MPPFWLGIILVLIFTQRFHLLPAAGYEAGVTGKLRTLTLPALTLALAISPMMVRVLRASIIDNLQKDFVEAARARGQSQRRIVWKHVMRNSLIPFVTVAGFNFAGLLSGAVAVETVFGIPGLGSLLVSSVTYRDYTTVDALVFIFAATVVAVNLLTDLVYVVLDPRVRL